MRPTLLTLATASAIAMSGFAAPVAAQDAKIVQTAVIGGDSAQERIDLSSKLRMLSQRIPSAACHLAKDLERDASQELLKDATIEFEVILSALEFGDADLNVMAAENRRRTLARIHALRKNWEPFNATAQAMIASDASDESLQILLADNMALLESANDLVSVVVNQYSNPNKLVQADAFLIDISGRQRMLTQKMSKEACILAGNEPSADIVAELQGTMEMFEVSLGALRHGMPEVGIRKPPTTEISAGLEDVMEEWAEVKPMLASILAGAEADADTQKRKFHALNSMMAKMNKVVGMYAQASKNDT